MKKYVLVFILLISGCIGFNQVNQEKMLEISTAPGVAFVGENVDFNGVACVVIRKGNNTYFVPRKNISEESVAILKELPHRD